MNKLEQILQFNKAFVENKEYDIYATSKVLKQENTCVILHGY